MGRRVRARLEDEPTILAPARRRVPGWVRPAAGLAIAASVAAATVVVAPGLLTSSGGMDDTPVVVDAGPAATPPGTGTPVLVAAGSVPPPTARAVEPERWRALNDDYAERLNRLVIEHQEFGGRSGLNGPVAHLGLVSYDGR
jgi:sigma-E factor negative regulatory protein RseA